MFKGEFKTARLQREIPVDAIVVDDELVVGELVKVMPATDARPAIVSKLVAETDVAAKAEATHIMAQSDMTLGYGHVPVEYADYRYSDVIKESPIDYTKLEGVGIDYFGLFDSSSDLPTDPDDVSSNDTALVLDSTNGVYDKYVATATTVNTTTTVTWAKATSTAAYSVAVDALKKKVAMYKIINVDDLIVVNEN